MHGSVVKYSECIVAEMRGSFHMSIRAADHCLS